MYNSFTQLYSKPVQSPCNFWIDFKRFEKKFDNLKHWFAFKTLLIFALSCLKMKNFCSQATVKKVTAGYWLLCVQLASFQEFISSLSTWKTFLLWVVNTCCDWSSDRERNCLSNLWCILLWFDTKTILNSEMKTIFNSLRIIGVKTHWIFVQVKRSKTWGLFHPRAKENVLYW